MKPGVPKRVDDKYERQGVRSLLMFDDPIAGWRRVCCRESRIRTDWALEVKLLLDVDYPNAEVITLVCDNLNTHELSTSTSRSMPKQRAAFVAASAWCTLRKTAVG